MVDRLPEFQGPKYAGSYSWAPSIRVARNSDYGTTGLSVGQRVFGLADWPMGRFSTPPLKFRPPPFYPPLGAHLRGTSENRCGENRRSSCCI